MNTSDYQLLATSDRYRDVAAFWRRQIAAVDDGAAIARTDRRGARAGRQSLDVAIGAAAGRALGKLSADSLGRFTVVAAAIALAAARYFNSTATLLRAPLLLDDGDATLNPDREVPLVFSVAGDTTLREFLRASAGIVEQSYEHQDYPIGMLFEEERGVSMAERADFSVSSSAIHREPLVTVAPIHFNCDGIDEGRIAIHFDPASVDPSVVSGLAWVLSATLDRFEELSLLVRDVERVPDDQRARLMVEWNRTEVLRPFLSVVDAFEERVSHAPDAVALQFGETRFTYAELNRHANQLAHFLAESGHANGGPAIGIWVDRSPWMVVAVFGVLKAGLAYLPLAADIPHGRLAAILRDSGVRRVITDQTRQSIVQSLGCDAVLEGRAEEDADAANPGVGVRPSDLAYLIYTSGSTGEPKGCAVEHHSLSNYLQWAVDYYWTEADAGTMGLFSPLSFDLTVTSLFCPLLRGRTLVVYPQQALIADVLRQQFERGSPIDAIKLTPSHIRLLDPDELHGTNIRLAIVGGEALTLEQVAILKRIDSRIRVINEYGPTEATVGCVVKEVERGEPVTIGRPIANTRIYVLDEAQQLVPIGTRGEVCIAGDGLARGYHARPDLTAGRFVANPFEENGRLYRTGDVGRWLPSGELECFGRLDSQVKIRGYRIELGEVEAALRRCDGVREAVVVSRAFNDEPALVAFIVGDGGVATAALRLALAATLPEYMVPSAFVRLDGLPLTTNGKIDYRRLPRYSPESRARPPYVEPRTAEERTVARIWEGVFHRDAIGLGEDFFELGGHSLRAMEMLLRIHQACGVDVSISEVLSNPTVAALAAVIGSKQPSAIQTIQPAPPAETYALSHGQRSLWVINRIEEGSSAYNVSTAFELRGALDVDALTRAVGALVARHASLRTVFVEIDDEPRQRVLPIMPLDVKDVDLRGASDPDGHVRAIVERQASEAFDLTEGPLLRVAVIRIDELLSVLALTIHHIVSDEWSMRILIGEIVEVYDGDTRGTGARLEPLTIQYPDYAVWQRESLASPAAAADRDYWLRQLSGDLGVLDLATDGPRPAVQTFAGRHHRLTIDAAIVTRLKALGASRGASPFMTLVAVVKVLLHRYTAQHDVRVGVPIAGRTREELGNQIGFFVNTLVLRDQVNSDEPFVALLDRVKRTAEAAYEHQRYPFDRLVDELDLPRDLSRSPLFDVMVAYEAEPDIALSAGGLDVREIRLESGVTKFDLTLAFAEAGGGLDVEIEYNTDLFRADRIARMAGHLAQLMASVVADEGAPIGRIAVIPERERRQILESFNDTAVARGPDTIVSLFERQVAQTPDRVAVSCQDRRLTYRELNERANRLAHRLIAAHGVEPGDCVAVLMDRSELVAVALLGILKAGAAYVPLDRGSPEQRVAFIVSDTRAKTIVRDVDVDVDMDGTGPSTNPARGPAPVDLAYILYTSGSTGEPKGVMVEHRSVVNALQFVRSRVLGAGARSQAACASFAFDVSVQELFANLIHGNTVDIVPDDIRRDPQRLLEYVATRGIDMVDCTPSVFWALLEAGLAERQDVRVSDWFIGAEALSPELLRRYYANGAHRVVRVTNFYGPTECTINATWWSTDGDRFAAVPEIPIGHPIDNCRTYILDEQRQPVPIGIPGEICIGGAGVARGYLNQPELTAGAFVDDPFRPGERLYRSGDRGRWRADGAIEFIGRLDDQVKIRGYRIEPAEIERALRRHPAIRDAAVMPFAEDGGQKLVAFVMAGGTAPVDEAGLRGFLSASLPAYMIPAEFIVVDAIALSASGKLDRGRLRERPPQAAAVPSGGANAPLYIGREVILLGVIESALGRTGIRAHDNFFHVGGDSIKAIQIVNRLARQGWTLRVLDLFEAPRIAQLALRLARAPGPGPLEQLVGDVPLTPMQRWFFETQGDTLAHYNQSVMLRFADRIDEQALRQVGRAIVRQHDALRFRYRADAGRIVQSYGDAYDPVDVRDLRSVADPAGELERQAADVQASLDLEHGPLARFVLFRLRDDDRLLAVIHHLAVDGVSWRILLEDLRLGLEQAVRGVAIDLGAKSASFQAWVSALDRQATDHEPEGPWWDRVERTAVCALPRDSDAGDPLEADAREQRTSLTVEDTNALLSRVHHAYNTRINDVLLAALARAMREWAGEGAVRLDLETHGREGVDGVDVTRTVGWFTALYPVVLDLGEAHDAGAQIKIVKESLRRTPGHGLGYGLLHRAAHASSSIAFNFLGQFDSDIDGFEIADERRGAEQGPLARMSHDLEIGGWISQGRAHFTVRYSPKRFRDRTIDRFLSAYRIALEELIAHCRDRQARERTASDYRYGDRTTPALIERLGGDRVEDVYPLSPMQQGMLYHAALATDSPLYVEQFVCAIAGPLDEDAFRLAWDRVIERHTALRTAFFWTDVEQPLQVVFARVHAPWTVHDWRAVPAAEQPSRLDAFADTDRRRGLNLGEPPLMRFTLIRTGDETYRFYWTSHHILLDGWSTAIVLQDAFGFYQAAATGVAFSPEPVRPFGEYIDWLRGQDSAQAEAYWRERLRGFPAPTALPHDRRGAPSEEQFSRAELTLPADATMRLTDAARDHRLTLNTVARGVWALLLAAHSRRHDVVFGATVAGRPAALPGVETIAGLFINTLPVRVRIDAGAPLAVWLQRLQIDHADLDQHAHSSLADIQRVSEMPRRVPLFDSILVFENYPVDQSIDPGVSDLVIDGIDVREQTNYPLTVSVVPGDRLLLRLAYDTTRFDAAAARSILREMDVLFDAFVDAPDATVVAIMARAGRAQASHPRDTFELDESAAGELAALAARLDAPPAIVARALCSLLACRYAASEDLRCVVGSTVVSRDEIRDADGLAPLLKPAATADTTGPADLRFEVSETPERVSLTVASETGRFDQAFLRRTSARLAEAIHSLLINPRAPLDHVAILPAEERSQLVDGFNNTDRAWGDGRTIAQLFEEQAAAHPDRIAVVVPAVGRDDGASEQVWTYGELNARANRLARFLVRQHRVGPDVRVGVLLERSADMVLALVAIEKAGGAYVPLDPDYPRDLLRFMMDDCGAVVILTQQKLQHLAGVHAGPIVYLDADRAHLAAEAEGNLPSRVTGDNLAYVIYTSGSTGRSKGAMNTHRGIANRLLWMQEAYVLTEHDRVLQKTPFSFDVSVWEFFWPLMAGARLVVAKPVGHRDPSYLTRIVEDERITTLHFVPSMLQAFIDEPDMSRCRSLTRVVCSGEALSPELLRRYRARLDVPLFNLYGPTEAAVDVTAWRANPAEAESMVPIGTPIANTQIYILDARLQPVPEGVSGELFIGGAGVGRGYLNRPELTKEKFIPDPFRSGRGGTLYRTGDLARFRHDGTIEFLGRRDHQVKLRGFRIELGEIESALLSHAAVHECVVVVREDQPGSKELVAYVVPKPGAVADASDLRAHLDRTLPVHMIPGVMVPLPELPRLTNGKLDRTSLPAPYEIAVSGRRTVAPRDSFERRLVRVWEQLLGVSGIGVTDDFFELGGHSILAVKMVSAIRLEFGRTLALAQLLAHPTIERLAVALQTEGDSLDWRPLVQITRGGTDAPLFLLPGAGGNVVYFHALAQHLSASRPIYGLQAIGLDGRTPPLITVEAIAAANVAEMRRVCPAGPYFLAGHSFGGRVALEMVQQLRHQGQSIGLLAVLDTAAPLFDPIAVGADWTDAHWLAKIAREIDEFFGIRLDVNVDELLPLPLEEQLTRVVERMQRAGAWAPGADSLQLRGYLRVYKANTQAAHVRYDSFARVPVALFKALENDPGLDETPAGLIELTSQAAWGWERIAQDRVHVVDVPGAHLTMLAEPHVGALALALDAALHAAAAALKSPDAGTTA